MDFRSRLALTVGAITTRAATFVAPTTPWLYLALRRALIPTVCWVVLAVMFFLVPQSREVLHGLCEPLLESISDYHDQNALLVNPWALVSYLGTSIFLAFSIWYSARLLTTVEADDATPEELKRGAGLTGLKFATTWLPRILSVSALSASIGAMIYANYTPTLFQLSALALAGAAVVGPIAIVAGVLLRRRPGARVPLTILGMLLFAGAVVALFVWREEKWRVFAWCAAASCLPAAWLLFILRRRMLISALRMDPAPAADAARQFGTVVVNIAAILVGSVVVLGVLAVSPVNVARRFGSASSVLLFLAATVFFVTALQLILRRIARNVPGLTTATVILVTGFVFSVGRESLGREYINLPNGYVAASAAATTSASGPSPTVYVHAYGGGIRAAVFTAEILARADDASCGKFGDRVAALSGVSGGSLGIATYLVARQHFVAAGGWKGCPATDAKTAAPLTDIVAKALVQDHLSPAIARMLAFDAPHLYFWGSPIRGQALLDSWNGALLDALKDKVPGNVPSSPGLAMPLADLTGGMAPPPRVYFNATDADRGSIVWFSNLGPKIGPFAQPSSSPLDRGMFGNNQNSWQIQRGSTAVGLAVLDSARFPIISPAGAQPPDRQKQLLARLVDGGYADNSGALTLMTDYQDKDTPHPSGSFVIDIDGNSPEQSACGQRAKRSPLITALNALLQARSAHAALAAKQAASAVDAGHALRVVLDLEEAYAEPGKPPSCDPVSVEKVRRAQQAPLGWYVGYASGKTIDDSARIGVAKICAQVDVECPALQARDASRN